MNWVDDAEVVYIGKADELRRRLRQFADFGAGKPVGDWGGRLIWQLVEAETLLVAWKETPAEVPAQAEARLINEFRDHYGKPPFANDPHRTRRLNAAGTRTRDAATTWSFRVPTAREAPRE